MTQNNKPLQKLVYKPLKLLRSSLRPSGTGLRESQQLNENWMIGSQRNQYKDHQKFLENSYVTPQRKIDVALKEAMNKELQLNNQRSNKRNLNQSPYRNGINPFRKISQNSQRSPSFQIKRRSKLLQNQFNNKNNGILSVNQCRPISFSLVNQEIRSYQRYESEKQNVNPNLSQRNPDLISAKSNTIIKRKRNEPTSPPNKMNQYQRQRERSKGLNIPQYARIQRVQNNSVHAYPRSDSAMQHLSRDNNNLVRNDEIVERTVQRIHQQFNNNFQVRFQHTQNHPTVNTNVLNHTEDNINLQDTPIITNDRLQNNLRYQNQPNQHVNILQAPPYQENKEIERRSNNIPFQVDNHDTKNKANIAPNDQNFNNYTPNQNINQIQTRTQNNYCKPLSPNNVQHNQHQFNQPAVSNNRLSNIIVNETKNNNINCFQKSKQSQLLFNPHTKTLIPQSQNIVSNTNQNFYLTQQSNSFKINTPQTISSPPNLANALAQYFYDYNKLVYVLGEKYNIKQEQTNKCPYSHGLNHISNNAYYQIFSPNYYLKTNQLENGAWYNQKIQNSSYTPFDYLYIQHQKKLKNGDEMGFDTIQEERKQQFHKKQQSRKIRPQSQNQVVIKIIRQPSSRVFQIQCELKSTKLLNRYQIQDNIKTHNYSISHKESQESNQLNTGMIMSSQMPDTSTIDPHGIKQSPTQKQDLQKQSKVSQFKISKYQIPYDKEYQLNFQTYEHNLWNRFVIKWKHNLKNFYKGKVHIEKYPGSQNITNKVFEDIFLKQPYLKRIFNESRQLPYKYAFLDYDFINSFVSPLQGIIIHPLLLKLPNDYDYSYTKYTGQKVTNLIIFNKYGQISFLQDIQLGQNNQQSRNLLNNQIIISYQGFDIKARYLKKRCQVTFFRKYIQTEGSNLKKQNIKKGEIMPIQMDKRIKLLQIDNVEPLRVYGEIQWKQDNCFINNKISMVGLLMIILIMIL